MPTIDNNASVLSVGTKTDDNVWVVTVNGAGAHEWSKYHEDANVLGSNHIQHEIEYSTVPLTVEYSENPSASEIQVWIDNNSGLLAGQFIKYTSPLGKIIILPIKADYDNNLSVNEPSEQPWTYTNKNDLDNPSVFKPGSVLTHRYNSIRADYEVSPVGGLIEGNFSNSVN